MESPLDFTVCDIAGIWRKSPLQLEICPLLKKNVPQQKYLLR